MGYPWGYSASPRNTLGISHTPQLPWGLSITYIYTFSMGKICCDTVLFVDIYNVSRALSLNFKYILYLQQFGNDMICFDFTQCLSIITLFPFKETFLLISHSGVNTIVNLVCSLEMLLPRDVAFSRTI